MGGAVTSWYLFWPFTTTCTDSFVDSKPNHWLCVTTVPCVYDDKFESPKMDKNLPIFWVEQAGLMEPRDKTLTEQEEPSNYLRTAIPASLQVPFTTEEVQHQEPHGQQRTAELPDQTVLDQQSHDEESLPDIFTSPAGEFPGRPEEHFAAPVAPERPARDVVAPERPARNVVPPRTQSVEQLS